MENKENTNSGKLKIITSPASQSNIEQAFGKYDFNITDEQVSAAVKKIIAEKVPENDNLETKKFEDY